MLDPVTSAALIKTGGSLVSGLLGRSGKTSWKDKWATFQNDQEMQEKALAQKFRLAKQYKIHPLTMLGANTPQISSPVYQSKSDNMGQNAVRALTQGASSYFTGKANQEIENLQLERARLENDLLRSQITSINRPAGVPQSSSLPQSLEPQTGKAQLREAQTPMGYKHGTQPFLTVGIDPETGKPFRVYNEDLGDNEVLQAATALGITMPDLIHGRYTQKQAQKLVPVIKKLRNAPKGSRKFDKKAAQYISDSKKRFRSAITAQKVYKSMKNWK